MKWLTLDDAGFVFEQCEAAVPIKKDKQLVVSPRWHVSTPEEAGTRLRQNFRLAEVEKKNRDLAAKYEDAQQVLRKLKKKNCGCMSAYRQLRVS